MVLLVLSWLTVTLFLILRALLAYLRVLRVSMKSVSLGEIQAIITVWLLPADNRRHLVTDRQNNRHSLYLKHNLKPSLM